MTPFTKKMIAAGVLIVLSLSACQAATPAVPRPEVELPTFVAVSPGPTATIAASSCTPTVAVEPADTVQPALPPVLWSFQTKGAIWGTPSIEGQTVYIGSDDGNLYAVDAHTGEERWHFATAGLVRSRPSFSNGIVYLTSDDGFLYAIDSENGQQVWRTDIGNFSEPEKRQNPGNVPDPTIFDYLQSSPIVSEGRAYVGSADGNVYAVGADTGTIVWSVKTGQKVRATPAVEDGVVYVGSWDGTVYALDALSGETRWKTSIGGQVQSTAAVFGGLVYTGSRKASVVALDARTGQKRWECDYGRNMWVESSPQVVDDLVYVGSSGNHYVLGLDRRIGEVLSAYKGEAFFWSTPAIEGDTLYIGGEAYTKTDQVGGLFSLEMPAGASLKNRVPMKLRWLLPVTDTLMPDGYWAGVASSPLISGDVIYFGALDGKLYALWNVS